MRQWLSFDRDTLDQEFRALPRKDMIDLFEAMKAYRMEVETGWVVKNYGNGLLMIKPSNKGAGRCLFFAVRSVSRGGQNVEELIALLAYKKESQDVPKAHIRTARSRMSQYEEEKRSGGNHGLS